MMFGHFFVSSPTLELPAAKAGFMRMLRGVDESGIESIAEAAQVEVARRGDGTFLGLEGKKSVAGG